MYGLLLEGICGTGKTTLLHSLQRAERFTDRTYPSSIVLSEHQTQRVLEYKERVDGLVVADNLALLEQHVAYFEALQHHLDEMVWCNNGQTAMRIPYILERFHFTHVYHYSHMAWEDVAEIDRRLGELNCKLCVLTIDDAVLEERIISSRNASWRRYISRFGKTDAEIIAYYSEQQNLLRALFEKSVLEKMMIDTTKASVRETLRKVIDFWGAI